VRLVSKPSIWRKSTYSGTCVEAAKVDGIAGIRDSKDPRGPVLTLTGSDWTSLISTLKRR
jgi:hypothetical protein